MKNKIILLYVVIAIFFAFGCKHEGEEVVEIETGLPPSVGQNVFKGTSWQDGNDSSNWSYTKTYTFNNKGIAKYDYHLSSTSSSGTKITDYSYYYYYSFNTTDEFLYMKLKSMDYLKDGTQYSSFPSKKTYRKFQVELKGSDSALETWLEENDYTWDSFYQKQKQAFEKEMSTVHVYPYSMSESELELHSGYLGNEPCLEDFVENNILKFSVDAGNFSCKADNDNGVVLTVKGGNGSENTVYTSVAIEGNTITWDSGDTSICSVLWNNSKKEYKLSFSLNDTEYYSYREVRNVYEKI